MQQVSVTLLFDIQQCVYINPNPLIYPPPRFPFGKCKFKFKIFESLTDDSSISYRFKLGLLIFLQNVSPGSSLVAQWVKDLTLLLQQLRWQLWCMFNPWSGNFCMLWMGPPKKKKKVFLPSIPFIRFLQSKTPKVQNFVQAPTISLSGF